MDYFHRMEVFQNHVICFITHTNTRSVTKTCGAKAHPSAPPPFTTVLSLSWRSWGLALPIIVFVRFEQGWQFVSARSARSLDVTMRYNTVSSLRNKCPVHRRRSRHTRIEGRMTPSDCFITVNRLIEQVFPPIEQLLNIPYLPHLFYQKQTPKTFLDTSKDQVSIYPNFVLRAWLMAKEVEVNLDWGGEIIFHSGQTSKTGIQLISLP